MPCVHASMHAPRRRAAGRERAKRNHRHGGSARWIARGQMRPLDARLLLMHIWAMTQSYADYALQTRVMLGLPPDAPIEREPIARELVAFVLGGCGIKA